jgi:hypothetical protein
MTLPRLYSLSSYWLKHPPTHLLVAGFFGYKAREIEEGKEEASLDDLIGAFRDAGLAEKK